MSIRRPGRFAVGYPLAQLWTSERVLYVRTWYGTWAIDLADVRSISVIKRGRDLSGVAIISVPLDVHIYVKRLDRLSDLITTWTGSCPPVTLDNERRPKVP